MSSCATCLIKKLRHFHLFGYGPDWLAGIVVNHDLDLTNKFGSTFLIRMMRVRLLISHTFVITIVLIQLLPNPLCRSQIYTKTLWNFHIRASSVNAMLYNVLFPNFWKSELHHGVAFYTDSTQLTLVWCTVEKTWNKQSTCAKLIIHFKSLILHMCFVCLIVFPFHLLSLSLSLLSLSLCICI